VVIIIPVSPTTHPPTPEREWEREREEEEEEEGGGHLVTRFKRAERFCSTHHNSTRVRPEEVEEEGRGAEEEEEGKGGVPALVFFSLYAHFLLTGWQIRWTDQRSVREG
jgi:hypothetical protein